MFSLAPTECNPHGRWGWLTWAQKPSSLDYAKSTTNPQMVSQDAMASCHVCVRAMTTISGKCMASLMSLSPNQQSLLDTPHYLMQAGQCHPALAFSHSRSTISKELLHSSKHALLLGLHDCCSSAPLATPGSITSVSMSVSCIPGPALASEMILKDRLRRAGDDRDFVAN